MHFNMHILRHKFTLLADAFLKVGLVLEPSKTELMHFAPYLLDKPGKPLYSGAYPSMDLGVVPFTGSTPLKPSLLWRYLGFFFDSKLSFSSHVDYYVNKAFSTIRALRMLGNSIKGLDAKNRALVYKVAAFPILTYGAPLYWRYKGKGVLALLKRLQLVQAYVARWAIGAFCTTPGHAANVLIGFPPYCHGT
jgi:hypothetical protein